MDPPNNGKGKGPTRHFQPLTKPPVVEMVASNQVVDQWSHMESPKQPRLFPRLLDVLHELSSALLLKATPI